MGMDSADHYLNKAKIHRIPHWARGGHNVIQIANHTFMKINTKESF